jgi:hypothetical protein
VPAWAELSQEQYAVMITAAEEACLIHVMDAWRARQRWAETGSTLTPSDLDEVTKGTLIPRFSAVVLDLIDRGWVELREPEDAAESLQGAELHATVADPASWIRDDVDYNHRMVWLGTTDVWDSTGSLP